MSTPSLLIAVPSKGRLQEQVIEFFARAGLPLVRPRGARDYRGTLAGLDGAEVLFLSASEIARELGSGGTHLGITGEDLVREQMADADARVYLISALGFGAANVVVAVPQAWIDVRGMADLDDVAGDIRRRRKRPMRVATKYVTLTRQFFAARGIVDYKIVESLGATEGAPAAGVADVIVDITTTGSTLAANGLKVLDDGLILKSQAHLVASRQTAWFPPVLETARLMLARLGAAARARQVREVRADVSRMAPDTITTLASSFGASQPFPGSVPATFHVAGEKIAAFVAALTDAGAGTITVSALDEIFQPENAFYNALAREITAPA